MDNNHYLSLRHRLDGYVVGAARNKAVESGLSWTWRVAVLGNIRFADLCVRRVDRHLKTVGKLNVTSARDIYITGYTFRGYCPIGNDYLFKV